jgi:trigger factor
MQVSVESGSGLERRVRIQIEAAEIESEIEKRLVKVGRRARIKGFRPGKAPLKVLRQQYGPQVRQEVLSEVMQSSYNQAINQEQLRPAGSARIEPHNTEQGQDLDFTAVIEVYPEFEVADVSRLKIERPVADITEKDVDAMIENLRKQRAEWIEAARGGQDGDRVTVTFRGTIDGEVFDGGVGEDMPVILGAGETIPDFEQGLVGLKAGDEKVIDVRFPDDYPVAKVAGKDAKFEVSVARVEDQHLPELDDEFFKIFGVKDGGVEAFRTEVRANMQRELDRTVRSRLKQNVMERLREANEVELPQALVAQEIHSMQHDAARRMGITDHSRLPPKEPFEEQARMRVALGLIINQLIRQEKIEPDPQRVDARIDEMSAEHEEAEKVAQYYRSNPELKAQVEMMVLEDQVVDWLLERTNIKDTKTSFSKLMNFGEEQN